MLVTITTLSDKMYRLEIVDRNVKEAREYYPDSFGPELYIYCRVNNVPIRAFVDTGAECSFISLACAEKCNLKRLIDTRYVEKVLSVKDEDSVGRIHLAQLQISNIYMYCSFCVVEEGEPGLILGLDVLRRYQCSIELKTNELVIGTTNTRVPFLSEADLKYCEKFDTYENSKSNNESTKVEQHIPDERKRSIEAPWPRYVKERGNKAVYYSTKGQLSIEEIRLINVNQNRRDALEYYPESFGSIYMLYIDCHINNVPIKALVDSGADGCYTSLACAEKCNLKNLIDTSIVETVYDIGEENTLGKIHRAQLQIGNIFLNCSFDVFKEHEHDVILGLDVLRRYKCSIELKTNELVIGTTNTRVPFLSGADLPEYEIRHLLKHESTQV